MKAPAAFTRGEEPFVPPEQVMTRLMQQPAPRSGGDASWVGYLLLFVFMAGVLAGLFLAAGG